MKSINKIINKIHQKTKKRQRTKSPEKIKKTIVSRTSRDSLGRLGPRGTASDSLGTPGTSLTGNENSLRKLF